MASIIDNGTTADTSIDIVLADGASTQLALRSAAADSAMAPGSHALVQRKDSAGAYLTIGALTPHEPAKLLSGPGTFRVTKPASAVSFGVDRD